MRGTASNTLPTPKDPYVHMGNHCRDYSKLHFVRSVYGGVNLSLTSFRTTAPSVWKVPAFRNLLDCRLLLAESSIRSIFSGITIDLMIVAQNRPCTPLDLH